MASMMQKTMEGSRPRAKIQRGHGKRLCKKDCQVHNLNKEVDTTSWYRLDDDQDGGGTEGG